MSEPLSVSKMCLLPYIDDLAVLGTCPYAVNDRHTNIKQLGSECSLPVHIEKDNPASSTRPLTTCLGMSVHQTGRVTPKPPYLNALLDDTNGVLQLLCSTPCAMQRLLGRWVWPLLLRRPLLSTIMELYKFTALNHPQLSRSLSVSQLVELQALLGLAPVVFRDLTRPVSGRLYATDASPWGTGIVYWDDGDVVNAKHPHQELVTMFWDARVIQGWYAFPDMLLFPITQDTAHCDRQFDKSREYDAPIFLSQRLIEAWSADQSIASKWSTLAWLTAIIQRWRIAGRAYYINILEVEALILAFRHMGKSPITRGKGSSFFYIALLAWVLLRKVVVHLSVSIALAENWLLGRYWHILSSCCTGCRLSSSLPMLHHVAMLNGTPLASQLITAFGSISVLQKNAVTPRTTQVYCAGVLRFAEFYRERDLRSCSADDVDEALRHFLVWTYQDDPSSGAKNRMVHAVFGYELLVPAHRKKMVGCRLVLRSWDRLVPRRSLPPLSYFILNGVACECEKRGISVYNVSFRLQFNCYLRVNELLNLSVQEIALFGDARLTHWGFDFSSWYTSCRYKDRSESICSHFRPSAAATTSWIRGRSS